jgi:N-acetylglucosamine kinase-like BadF-type ATPase
MIIIADSGSTKCDWALIDEKGMRMDDFQTMGLNPYFHSPDVIEKAIKDNAPFYALADQIKHIFFYGAGSSTSEMHAIMRAGLERVFKHAEILVEHDQLGSAMAVYDGEPCIACILGTGSNSCYFDGENVSEEVPSLAYILGDEASGGYFGKILLQEYFYKKLPADLRASFEEKYAPTKDEIINKIYREPNANVYLASFMKFIGEHRDHPHVKEWVKRGMLHFIDIHVKCFANYREVPVHFVGSIGHYFHDCLQAAADEAGIRLGKVIRKPIDGLVEYHVKYKLPALVGN